MKICILFKHYIVLFIFSLSVLSCSSSPDIEEVNEENVTKWIEFIRENHLAFTCNPDRADYYEFETTIRKSDDTILAEKLNKNTVYKSCMYVSELIPSRKIVDYKIVYTKFYDEFEMTVKCYVNDEEKFCLKKSWIGYDFDLEYTGLRLSNDIRDNLFKKEYSSFTDILPEEENPNCYRVAKKQFGKDAKLIELSSYNYIEKGLSLHDGDDKEQIRKIESLFLVSNTNELARCSNLAEKVYNTELSKTTVEEWDKIYSDTQKIVLEKYIELAKKYPNGFIK